MARATQSALNDTAARIRADFPTALTYTGGLTKQNDSVMLGGLLKYNIQRIATRNRIKDWQNNKNLTITNDTSTSPFTNTPYSSMGLFNVDRLISDQLGDTSFTANYNQPVTFTQARYFDQYTQRHNSTSTWFSPLRNGLLAQTLQYLPQEKAFTAPGIYSNGSGAPMVSFVGMGNTWGYNLQMLGSDYYGKIPWPAYLSDIDLDKQGAQFSDIKRTMTGGYGMAGYVSGYRNIQKYIDDATVNEGSRFGVLHDYVSMGTFQGYGIGVTHKDSMLAVNRVDTLIGFRSFPKRTSNNEVVNGFGFLQEGREDLNWFGGRVYVQDVMPVYGSWFARHTVGDTTLGGTVGSLTGKGHTLWPGQNNDGEKTSKYGYASIVFKDGFNRIANGNHFGTRGVLDYYNNNSTDTIFRNNSGNRISAGVQGLIRFNTGTSSTASYVGENGGVLSGVQSRFDWAASTILSSLSYTGKTAAFHSLDDFDAIAAGTIEWHSGIDIGQYKSPSSLTFSQKNGVYIRPIKLAQVTKAYAIYQEGSADTVLLNGLIKAPNIANGARVYTLGVDALGNFVKSDTATGGATETASNGLVKNGVNIGLDSNYINPLARNVRINASSNGFNIDSAEFRVDGASKNSYLYLSDDNENKAQLGYISGINSTYVEVDGGGTDLYITNGTKFSTISLVPDSIILNSTDYKIHNLKHSTTATDKMLVWDSVAKKVATRAIPSGGGSISGSGTTGTLTKWASSTSLTDAVAGTDYLTPSGSGASLTGVVHTTGAESVAGVKTFTDQIIGKAGTTSSVAYTFTGAGAGTGFWSPGASGVALSLGGTAYLNMDAGQFKLRDGWQLGFSTGDPTGAGSDVGLIRSGTNTITVNAGGGATTPGGKLQVLDDAYDATSWNGNNEVPTKNAIRDKIETISAGSGLTYAQSKILHFKFR
jgi:hypothetical protein